VTEPGARPEASALTAAPFPPWFPLGLGANVSALAWIWWGGPSYSPEVFYVLTAVVAVVLGVAGSARSLVGAALGAGPFLLAGWTQDVGDGDGLWALVFPLLIGWGCVLTLLAVASDAAVRRIGLAPGRRLLTTPAAAMALAAAGVVAIVLVQHRWAHQWDVHVAALGAFPPVTGTTVVDEIRQSRCRLACPDNITREITVPLVAVADLEARWRDKLGRRGLAGVDAQLRSEDYDQIFPAERRTRVFLKVSTPPPRN